MMIKRQSSHIVSMQACFIFQLLSLFWGDDVIIDCAMHYGSSQLWCKHEKSDIELLRYRFYAQGYSQNHGDIHNQSCKKLWYIVQSSLVTCIIWLHFDTWYNSHVTIPYDYIMKHIKTRCHCSHIDILAQNYSDTSAIALELLQSYTKPSQDLGWDAVSCTSLSITEVKIYSSSYLIKHWFTLLNFYLNLARKQKFTIIWIMDFCQAKLSQNEDI